jgi:hypothetical protein
VVAAFRAVVTVAGTRPARRSGLFWLSPAALLGAIETRVRRSCGDCCLDDRRLRLPRSQRWQAVVEPWRSGSGWPPRSSPGHAPDTRLSVPEALAYARPPGRTRPASCPALTRPACMVRWFWSVPTVPHLGKCRGGGRLRGSPRGRAGDSVEADDEQEADPDLASSGRTCAVGVGPHRPLLSVLRATRERHARGHARKPRAGRSRVRPSLLSRTTSIPQTSRSER